MAGATRCEEVWPAGLCRVREGMAVREWLVIAWLGCSVIKRH